jgi:photoactive yellow protein
MPDDNSTQDTENSSFAPPGGSANPDTTESDEMSASPSKETSARSTDGNATASPSQEESPSHEDDDPTVEELHFDDDNLGEKLRHASEEQLNNASFGIIQVDDEGLVEFFNQYESDLSGMDPDEVQGRNFFTQVAPCTNNRLFRGRFKKGVRRGELDETFTYTYTYKMRPTLVDVHLYRDESGNNWITVQKY